MGSEIIHAGQFTLEPQKYYILKSLFRKKKIRNQACQTGPALTGAWI